MMKSQNNLVTDDLLWRHLKTLPAFRAFLRAVESQYFRLLDLAEPILDLGCGDGNFATLTFEHPLTVGIDPWWNPLLKSRESGAYKILIQGLGNQLPFPSNYFGSVISNSVLEHIPEIDPVLKDIARVLKPGGKLVVTMPTHKFTEYLGGSIFLERFGLKDLADAYRLLFNRIARHAHTDAPEIWRNRFNRAGLKVIEQQEYFSVGALHALEIGHAYGLPSAILHYLTGHWILAPWQSNLVLTDRWLRKYFEEELISEGTMVFFVAGKPLGGPSSV